MKKVVSFLALMAVTFVGVGVAVLLAALRVPSLVGYFLDHFLLHPASRRWTAGALAAIRWLTVSSGLRLPPVILTPAPETAAAQPDVLDDLLKQASAPGVVGAPPRGTYDALHVGLEAKALTEAVEALNRRSAEPGWAGCRYFWSRMLADNEVGDGHLYGYTLWVANVPAERGVRPVVATRVAIGSCQDLVDRMRKGLA